ncbi:CAP domain-containing protein [Gottfriedia sp. S16(2024)]|uniref:CAP domain-containing protein n=1 Tax=Gottfriedia sp. S16(2024) TaxID=3162883 RepID=UPI003D203FBA
MKKTITLTVLIGSLIFNTHTHADTKQSIQQNHLYNNTLYQYFILPKLSIENIFSNKLPSNNSIQLSEFFKSNIVSNLGQTIKSFKEASNNNNHQQNTTIEIPNIPFKLSQLITPNIPLIPVQPITPNVPSNPVQPIKPNVPSKPAKPVIPNVPSKPAKPVIPNVPSKPAKPVIPNVPSKPAQPVIPNVPSKPTQPVIPNTPSKPIDPAPENPSKIEVPASLSAYESKVIELTNIERTKAGIKPFKANNELSKVSRIKSKDMTDKNYFDHNSPTYGSPFDMMKKFGISYNHAAENIAKGQKTPEEVVKAWMNSAGHRANILNAKLDQIGVGYDSRSNAWTQMFISQ